MKISEDPRLSTLFGILESLANEISDEDISALVRTFSSSLVATLESKTDDVITGLQAIDTDVSSRLVKIRSTLEVLKAELDNIKEVVQNNNEALNSLGDQIAHLALYITGNNVKISRSSDSR